jgi:hypothetical protein
MTADLALFQTDPEPVLTARQQRAYDYLAAHDGVTADEVGAYLHGQRDRNPHGMDTRCDWCGRDGLQVLRSKALAPHITYRKDRHGRLYLLRGGAPTAAVQIEDLPGETWEDIFS